MKRFARLPAATRTMVFLTMGLPFALASLVASARYGAEHRDARVRELTAAAGRLVQSAGEAPTDQPDALLAAAAAQGFNAAVYRREDAGFMRLQSHPERFGETRLARRDARALLAHDRIVTARPSGGSLAVIAPARAADSRITGALLLVDSRTAPPLLPAVPVAAGLLALVLLLVAASAYAQRPSVAGALLVYAAPAAFFAWLLGGVGVAPGGGGYRYATVVLAAAWTALATIGLLRLRSAAPAAPPGSPGRR